MRNPFRLLLPLLLCLRASAASGHELGTIRTTATFRRDATYRVDVAIDRIFLLSTRLKPVLLQVTAFTVAHTITLALTIYGVVPLPSLIVEPLIAVSIVYVAAENVLRPRLSPWRVALVFGFGLLHGMGFAGVLSRLGVPRSEFLTALLCFNAGVELGQLSVILLAFVLISLPLRREPWYRPRVVVPASLAIAAVGLFWAVQRILPSTRNDVILSPSRPLCHPERSEGSALFRSTALCRSGQAPRRICPLDRAKADSSARRASE
jgi:hypothetical protein